MAQRQSVRGPRSSLLWLAIILILVLAIALAAVVFVIGPERQLAVQATATAQAYITQATATAQAHASEVQRAYDAGVAFATAGDWEKATEEFARVVALEPGYKDVTARLAEARANADAARVTATAEAIIAAEQAAAKATAETRSAIESAYQRGLAYLDLERWEQAKAEFEQVIAGDPNYKDVQAKMAEVEARLAEIRALTPTATLTITPGPSPTPPPTATNTPTTTPTKTPTPAPTATPTPTPTKTSTPTPTNTRTKRPTATQTPTETPIPNTPPGTILVMRETWTQGNLALTLTDAIVLPNSYDALQLRFSIVNISDRKFMIDVLKDSFYVYPDTGEEWQPSWQGACGVSQKDHRDVMLKPSQPFEFEYFFGRRPLPHGVSKFTVHVKNISDVIKDARWEIPIPRP